MPSQLCLGTCSPQQPAGVQDTDGSCPRLLVAMPQIWKSAPERAESHAQAGSGHCSLGPSMPCSSVVWEGVCSTSQRLRTRNLCHCWSVCKHFAELLLYWNELGPIKAKQNSPALGSCTSRGIFAPKKTCQSTAESCLWAEKLVTLIFS